MEIQTFPVDRDLPELAVAIDPAQVARLFSIHLDAGGGPLAVEECRVSRIRYRPRVRCVLQYSLVVRDERTAERTRHWVTGTMYADRQRAERISSEHAQAADAGSPEARLRQCAFIPELRMAVNVFPFDRKLPQATRLLRGRNAAVEEEVRRRLGDGAWTIVRWSAEPVRYREHLALVVRYDVEALDARTQTVAQRTYFLKAYPDFEQAGQAFAHVCRLARYAERSPLGVRIDMPVAWIEDLNAVLVERTTGQPLDLILRDGSESALTTAIHDTARALARFNLSDAPMRRLYGAAEHVAAVQRAARLLRCACPTLNSQLSDIVESIAAAASDAELRPTHRDMKLEHVLLGPEGPAFIDLDSSATADPVIDPALMLARLTASALDERNPSRMVRIRKAFGAEYFSRVPPAWRERLPSYYAAALTEVAAGIFHRQEPRWGERASRLIGHAHSAIAARRADGERAASAASPEES